jgi:hypothetical protein
VAGDFNAPVTTVKASIAFSRVYIALPDCRQVASNDVERGQKGGHRVKEKTQHHDIPATSRVCWPFNGQREGQTNDRAPISSQKSWKTAYLLAMGLCFK